MKRLDLVRLDSDPGAVYVVAGNGFACRIPVRPVAPKPAETQQGLPFAVEPEPAFTLHR